MHLSEENTNPTPGMRLPELEGMREEGGGAPRTLGARAQQVFGEVSVSKKGDSMSYLVERTEKVNVKTKSETSKSYQA